MGRPLSAARAARAAAGITLVELMIAIAILATVAAIALPAYRDYVETAAVGVLASQIATMEPFQQDTRLRTGSYGTGAWNSRTGDTSLTDATGWAPPERRWRVLHRTGRRGRLPRHRDRPGRPHGVPDHARGAAMLTKTQLMPVQVDSRVSGAAL